MKFKVSIARSEREYADVIVEAPDVETAIGYVEALQKDGNSAAYCELVNQAAWNADTEPFDEDVIDVEEVAPLSNPAYEPEADVTVPANWTPAADEPPDPDANWRNDAIQFPRVIAELEALLSPHDYIELAAAMDLRVEQVHELFDRAQATWDRIKSQTTRTNHEHRL